MKTVHYKYILFDIFFVLKKNYESTYRECMTKKLIEKNSKW